MGSFADTDDRDKMLRMCGNPLFESANKNLCSIAKQEHREATAFRTVKEYLESHPYATLRQVVADTKIAYELMKQFIDEGRIEFVLKKEEIDAIMQERGRLLQEALQVQKSLTTGTDAAKSRPGTIQPKGMGMRYIKRDGEDK